MVDARKCDAHCGNRERRVTEALERQLSPEEFSRYCAYVSEKRSLLEEQREIEERIRMGDAQLVLLKESLNKVHD